MQKDLIFYCWTHEASSSSVVYRIVIYEAEAYIETEEVKSWIDRWWTLWRCCKQYMNHTNSKMEWWWEWYEEFDDEIYFDITEILDQYVDDYPTYEW